jgi:tetratricopeptide (TPR) repeat protein
VPPPRANIVLVQGSLPCHYIPVVRNKYFTGREYILKTLGEKLFVQRCPETAIFGLGGVGKTQIAVRLMHWVKENHHDYSIFWVSALSVAAFEQAYSEVARSLSLQQGSDGEDVRETVYRYLSSEATGPWLIIIDNLDSKDLLFGDSGTPGGIYKYLPKSELGITLFTTRTREIATSIAGTDVIELHHMKVEEATEFMTKVLIRKELLQDSDATRELLDELRYLPLAIMQAAAYLNVNGTTIAAYLSLLHGTEQDLAQLLSQGFRDTHSGLQKAVATTWQVSFSQIVKDNSLAADLLSFISQIEPKAIPRSILPDRGSEEEKTRAIGTLSSYSFITERKDGVYDMHSLVHQATRIWLERDQRLKVVAEEATYRLADIFPSNRFTNQSLWRAYLPHALKVLRAEDCLELEATYDLYLLVGRCLQEDGRIRESVECFESSYNWRLDHHAEENNAKCLESQFCLGLACIRDGQVGRSIKLLENLVELAHTTLAENHPSRLDAQHALAMAYRDDGQNTKAIEMLEYISGIHQARPCKTYDGRLSVQNDLAVAYLSDGQNEKAIEILEHVVAIKQTTLPETHPKRLVSEHALALSYRASGQTVKAMEILEYITEVQQRTISETHPQRLSSEHALAMTYLDDGQVAKAMEILEHVVRMRQKVLSTTHSSLLGSQHQLAVSYRLSGQIAKAIEILEYVVEMRQSTLTDTHPHRLTSEHELAVAYEKDGQVAKAIEILEHIVEVENRQADKNHPNPSLSQARLGKLYQTFQRNPPN